MNLYLNISSRSLVYEVNYAWLCDWIIVCGMFCQPESDTLGHVSHFKRKLKCECILNRWVILAHMSPRQAIPAEATAKARGYVPTNVSLGAEGAKVEPRYRRITHVLRLLARRPRLISPSLRPEDDNSEVGIAPNFAHLARLFCARRLVSALNTWLGRRPRIFRRPQSHSAREMSLRGQNRQQIAMGRIATLTC